MRGKTRQKILDRLDLEPDEDVRFVNIIWMPDGNGLALALGRLFAKQADELASVLGAERI